MRTRTIGMALAAATLVVAGLFAPAAPAAAGAPSGMTTFDTTVPANCTGFSSSGTTKFDGTIVIAGTVPTAVTVGEAVTLSVTYVGGSANIGGVSGTTAYLHVDGPTSPTGDLYVVSLLKGTAPGRATITLTQTSGILERSPVGPVAVSCLPVGGPLTLATLTVTTQPVCFGLPATIVGTSRNDVLRGTSGPDVIVGRNGDDTIYGNGGDDTICGDHGNDRVNAGDGSDRVDGGYSNDIVNGQAGDDVLLGASGDDHLTGGTGADTIDGGIGVDVCTGENLRLC